MKFNEDIRNYEKACKKTRGVLSKLLLSQRLLAIITKLGIKSMLRHMH